MNKQQVYDMVRQHLLKQGCYSLPESEDDGEHCAYRGANGNKSPIGLLIKEEFYSKTIEGDRISRHPVRSAVELSLGFKLSKDDADFLEDLNDLHDREKVSEWPIKLKEFAIKHNLTP